MHACPVHVITRIHESTSHEAFVPYEGTYADVSRACTMEDMHAAVSFMCNKNGRNIAPDTLFIALPAYINTHKALQTVCVYGGHGS